MAINDVLSSLLEKVGLKKTEEGRVRDEIARLEEELRCFNDDLAALEKDFQSAEKGLRAAKAQYDAASGANKESLEMNLSTKMTDLKDILESKRTKLAQLNTKKKLLHQRRLDLDHLLHPVDTDALDEAAEAKRDMLDDFKERDEALAHLGELTYEPDTTDEISQTTAAGKDAKAAAQLEREFADLLGDDTPAQPVKPAEEETADKPQEIA